MLLLHFTVLAGLLSNTVSAVAITSFSPTPTLMPRDTTPISVAAFSTTPIDFITTKYITIAGVTNEHVTIPPKTIDIALPTCIQTITPDKNGYVPPGTCGALYDYYPSFAAAVVAAVLFGILTVAHIGQAALYKKKFCWVLIMGSIWETISFTARSISTKHQQSAGLELISSLFVLLAPLWINAFSYMVLARMIHFFLPSHSLFVPASVLSLIFVSLDFVSFVIQIVGGSYAGPTSPQDQIMKGIHIYMGGIGLQQFFIFIFLGLAVKFHVQMLALDRLGLGKDGWKRLLFTLYGSLGFITIRIFFRLIEFSGGKTSSNPLPFHESYFYILEALPMFCAILVFNLSHPGRILVGPEAELPSLKETIWGKWRKSNRGRKILVAEDGEELVSKYAMLGDGRDGSRRGEEWQTGLH